MATFPSRPSEFRLDVQRRYLKAFSKVLQSTPSKGLTEEELEYASDSAWRYMVTRLVGQYAISTWGDDPPHPLREVWELLASAVVIRIFGQSYGIESGIAESTTKAWEEKADWYLQNILDPEKERDRLYLVSSTGTIIEPRSAVSVPVVGNTRQVTFFPALDTDKSHGQTSSQNLESFFKTYTHPSGA